MLGNCAKLFVLTLFTVACCLLPVASSAQLKKIHWGVTSISASQWIPWIAKDARIYEKHGLEVELILLRGSGQSSQAILGGSIYAAPVALPTVINAVLGGADLVNVAHTVPGVQSKLLVKPEIKRPEDLRGKRIAVSTLGSLGDFLNRYILRKHGIEPGRDVIMFAVGNTPERIQALVSGNVEAADLSYPADVQAERLGFKVLWNARNEVTYPSMSVVTRRKLVSEDRDTVMRMLKAHVEAIHYLKTNKEPSTKILGKYLKTTERELLEGSYEFIATTSSPCLTRSPTDCKPPTSMSPRSGPKCGSTNRKRSWTRVLSRNWIRADLSKVYRHDKK